MVLAWPALLHMRGSHNLIPKGALAQTWIKSGNLYAGSIATSRAFGLSKAEYESDHLVVRTLLE